MFEIFWEGNFPETTVEVVAKDGKIYSETIREPKGYPRNNFTMEEEKEFFIARAADFIGQENAESFAEGIEKLEQCRDNNELTKFIIKH